MVESSLKLSAGRTTDGAVPFLGFAYERHTGERARRRCDSRICRPEIKGVNVCRGGGERRQTSSGAAV
jgi:hypothetical protein